MYRMLFTNRWAALAFVALMTISALVFVGTRPDDVLPPADQQKVPAQQDAGKNGLKNTARTAPRTGWSDGDQETDLVDSASGTVPAPNDGSNDDGGWGESAGASSRPSASSDPWSSPVSPAAASNSAGSTAEGNTVSIFSPGAEPTPKQGTFTSTPAE